MRTPFIVMSAVTGKPTKQDVAVYLQQLKDNGIEQFMIYPRSGCELEYLSEEWFDTVGYFIAQAKRLDMKVWLYDEFNWPSGDAGGKVTEKGYVMRGLKIKGENKGRISGHSLYNSGVFGVKMFPDVMSHEAVDYFIECTHEQYAKHFGEYFGNVIVGIFTDEPSINYACGDEDVPYYDGLETDYFDRCGRSLWEDIESDREEAKQNLSEVCISLAGERLCECFLNKISNWCRKHGLILTGHFGMDDSAFVSTKYNGDLLACQKALMMPGIDELWTKMDMPQLLTLMGSIDYARSSKMAAEQDGVDSSGMYTKKDYGAMAELYALGPCDMSYEVKRCMLYLSACFKVDHYFLAISPMDMRGNAKIKDYFNPFTADQPDFAGMKLLAKEAQTAATMAKWDYKPDVLVRHTSSLCARHMMEEPKDDVFTSLAEQLAIRQLQWKYIAEGETASGIPVIEFTEEFAYCLDGFVTDDPQAVCDRLEEYGRKELVVSDGKGEPVPGLFVRKYDNGECVVLNLFAPAGEYLVAGKPVFLDRYGVYYVHGENSEFDLSDRFAIAAEDRGYSGNGIPVQEHFSVSYGNPNIIRTLYMNDKTVSEIQCQCEEGMEVTFSVREDVCAGLGEDKFSDLVPDEIMPEGFRKFYRMSGPHHLKKGTSFVSAENELKYFPSVLISGEFSAEIQSGEINRIVLKERTQEYVAGERFADYGKVIFTAKVTVPEGAKGLVLKGTDLYTKVFIDDELVGERIFGPYLYVTKEQLQGKTVTLKIEQFSSLGPILGDIAYYDKNSQNVGWRGTPSPGATLFGFDGMNWIL